MQFQVAEIFTSINGEGMCAGELAVFVRFCGCNLHCSYCDTTWANKPDCPHTLMTAEEIFARICIEGIKNVTLTGGEPLLQQGIEELLQMLLREKSVHRVEIETNGSVALQPFFALREKFEREFSNDSRMVASQVLPEKCTGKKNDFKSRLVFTMDYKLAGSGMEACMCMENFRQLRFPDTVKFVVSDRADLERAFAVAGQYGLNGVCHIILSPVFDRIEPVKIVDFMKEQRWNEARVQLQLHKFIWAPDRTGV